MRVSFMGPPGAGKGVQATSLAAEMGVPHLSSGDILRAAIREGRLPSGLAADLAAGALAPESTILDIMFERLSQHDCDAGFVLDGFPRALTEAAALDAFLEGRGTGLDLVFYLTADTAVTDARVAGRLTTTGERRPEDAGAAHRRRMDIFAGTTMPVIDRYAARGLVVDIDASRSIPEVADDVRDASSAMLAKAPCL